MLLLLLLMLLLLLLLLLPLLFCSLLFRARLVMVLSFEFEFDSVTALFVPDDFVTLRECLDGLFMSHGCSYTCPWPFGIDLMQLAFEKDVGVVNVVGIFVGLTNLDGSAFALIVPMQLLCGVSAPKFKFALLGSDVDVDILGI
jgi:hypothetical protein